MIYSILTFSDSHCMTALGSLLYRKIESTVGCAPVFVSSRVSVTKLTAKITQRMPCLTWPQCNFSAVVVIRSRVGGAQIEHEAGNKDGSKRDGPHEANDDDLNGPCRDRIKWAYALYVRVSSTTQM